MNTKDIFKTIACIAAILACFTAGIEPSALTYICFGIIVMYLLYDYLTLSCHEHTTD